MEFVASAPFASPTLWTRLRPLILAATVLVAIGTGLPVHGQPKALQAKVDTIFNRWTVSTPGCAVGASLKGQPVVKAAYGMADLEQDVRNTPDTIFEAGSVSKQFTAMAVLLLVRDGKLSLDDPVRKYVPELHEAVGPVTIRQLLHHTSGLRDWGNLAAIGGWPRGTRVHTHAHVLDILSRQAALNFPPGTRWSYSNSGYNLAAIIVSRVSGMSFAEFSKARIFDPLGMKDTSWRDDYRRIVKRRAIAYSERRGLFAIEMPFENVHGNGGLLTTVGDLLKWNENFTTPRVGDAALVAEMQQPGRLNDGRPHEYAMGLSVNTYKGIRQVEHSGATAGYRAHLVRYPDQGVSVAVLCNAGSGNAPGYAKEVSELLLEGSLRAPAAPPSSSITLSDAEAERLVGLYLGKAPERAISIARDAEGFRLLNGPRLMPLSATRLTLPDSRVTLDLRGNELRVEEGATVDIFERVQPATPTADQLKALAGRYVSDEVETTLDVVFEADQLLVKSRPDSRLVLRAVHADTFASAMGLVVFRRGPRGVTALSVVQDRVWDLRFTRVK